MGFMEKIFSRVQDVFRSQNDELLFFILVFLFVFNSNLNRGCADVAEASDNGFILFFIVLFLLLFIGSDYSEDIP